MSRSTLRKAAPHAIIACASMFLAFWQFPERAYIALAVGAGIAVVLMAALYLWTRRREANLEAMLRRRAQIDESRVRARE